MVDGAIVRSSMVPSEEAVGSPEIAKEEAPVLHGRVTSLPATTARHVLRLVTGWAVFTWVTRILGMLLGFRQSARLSLVATGIRCEYTTSLLGRTIRAADEMHSWSSIATLARRTRYPALYLLVGALALSIGVILGGLYLFDGIRSGDTILLVAGAVVILAGAGLDLLLSVIMPGRKGEVVFDLRLLPKRALRLGGIPMKDAERFLRIAAASLPKK